MIVTEYIVKTSDGREVMRTADLQEAQAHDRLMEASERLLPTLGELPHLADLTELQLEDIAIALCKRAGELTPLFQELAAPGRGRKAAGRGKEAKAAETPAAADKVVPLQASGG